MAVWSRPRGLGHGSQGHPYRARPHCWTQTTNSIGPRKERPHSHGRYLSVLVRGHSQQPVPLGQAAVTSGNTLDNTRVPEVPLVFPAPLVLNSPMIKRLHVQHVCALVQRCRCHYTLLSCHSCFSSLPPLPGLKRLCEYFLPDVFLNGPECQ